MTAPSIKEALEFYADPFAWKKRHDPDNDVQVPDFYSELSFGDRAQETLASLTKSEGHGQDASVKCAATGVHPTDTSCTAEPEVAPGHSDALATFQPDGERREAIARMIDDLLQADVTADHLTNFLNRYIGKVEAVDVAHALLDAFTVGRR